MALAASVSLVLLAVVGGIVRAVRRFPYERLLAAAGVIAIVVIGRELSALTLSGLVVALVVAALFAEDRRGSEAWTARDLPAPRTRT